MDFSVVTLMVWQFYNLTLCHREILLEYAFSATGDTSRLYSKFMKTYLYIIVTNAP